MLNTNMEFSIFYAQHFQLHFHVFQSFILNTNVSTRVPEPLAQHKTSHRSCASGSTPNTNISSIMCFRVHAQHKHFINHVLQGPHPTQTFHQSCALGSTPNKNHFIYIYIINNWIASNIQNKSSYLYAVGSLTQYKIKPQYNHHDK